MKRKLILTLLLLITLLGFRAGWVLSQTNGILPRVEKACETKVGVLTAVNDGYSLLKRCPRNSREVVLGEKREAGGNQQIGAGEIAFLTGDMNRVLKKDGTAWWYNEMDKTWTQDTARTVIGIDIGNIVQWNVNSILTKDGDIWLLDGGTWTNIGYPEN